MTALSKMKKGAKNPGTALRHIFLDNSEMLKQIEDRVWETERDSGSPAGFITAGKIMQAKTGFSDRAIGKWPEKNPIGSKGYYELNEPIPAETIDKIQRKFDSEISNERFTNSLYEHQLPEEHKNEVFVRQMVEGIDGDDSTVDFFELFPELYDLVEQVRPDVSEYYDTTFRLLNSTARRTHHVPQEIINQTELYSNYWHIDGHPIDQLKIFIALSDITEDDGPFHYLPYEASQEILAQNYDREENGVPGSVIDSHSDIKTFTGKRGSVLVCNTNILLHRAGVPSKGNHRDLLTIQVSPTSRQCLLDESKQIKWGQVFGIERLAERLRW